jgi:hypothetical protein
MTSKRDKKALTPKQEAAVYVDIDTLVPWKDNPRVNEKVVPQIAKLIDKFGFGSPVLARKENNEIIAGHTRIKAAEMLGMKQVPVRFMDLSERDAHLMALADNRSQEFADWDVPMLLLDMEAYSLPELDLAGWNQSDLDGLGGVFDVDDADDPDLKDGDGDPLQQMTFTFHDEQVETIKQAISLAIKNGHGQSEINENSNGNALAWMAEKYTNG